MTQEGVELGSPRGQALQNRLGSHRLGRMGRIVDVVSPCFGRENPPQSTGLDFFLVCFKCSELTSREPPSITRMMLHRFCTKLGDSGSVPASPAVLALFSDMGCNEGVFHIFIVKHPTTYSEKPPGLKPASHKVPMAALTPDCSAVAPILYTAHLFTGDAIRRA